MTILLLAASGVAAKTATLTVDTDKVSNWTIDQGLYGRFFEQHGNVAYPGFYDQYIVNTSFEHWFRKGEHSLTPQRDVNPWQAFRDIPLAEGIAEPWEAVNPDATYGLVADCVNTDLAQKIENKGSGEAGVKQRLALPDYRSVKYNLRFYAKATDGAKKAEVRLVDKASGEVYAEKRLQLSEDWEVHRCQLDLRENRATSKHGDRFGTYELEIVFSGEGTLLLDQMTLVSDDAIDGQWNPDTVAALKDHHVTVVRWPGGNFASSYDWRDGIGEMDKRPTRPNLAWEGVEPNHIGTDEFLQFCKVAELTPLMCIGFGWSSPQEAGRWVEYCNGAATTEYGKLRAQNGHPEPYGVKLWQVGNEVYGHYQIGHTTAEDYAKRYREYYKAMKKADPTIEIMAMGKDPGYHENDDNAWNKTLMEIIGQDMDYIDIHRYVRGVRKQKMEDQWNKNRLTEVYISFSTQYETVIDSIRLLAKNNSLEVKLAVTEWAQYLSRQAGFPNAFSHGNAMFYAGMMNTFVRNSDFVAISCSHDMSLFSGNRSAWFTPPTPRNDVAKLYSSVEADRVLESRVECDAFDMERDVVQMWLTKDIPYIDAVATCTADKKQIVLFIVNRSVENDYQLDIVMTGLAGEKKATISALVATGSIIAPKTWKNLDVTRLVETEEVVSSGKLMLNVPKCSMARIIIE